MGKRGGARVVYYFYNTAEPIFLLSVYAKAEKADLSAYEKTRSGELLRRSRLR